jgi:hypothetical protein
MKKSEIININQVCSITIFPKMEADFKYNKQIKFLFFTLRKEGFYGCWSGSHYSEDEIKSDTDLYIENKKVFYIPFLIIKMSNSFEYKFYFNTIEELYSFIENKGFNESNNMIQITKYDG